MTPQARLTVAKRQWEKARDRKADALWTLNHTIREAAMDGMTQAEIGRALGWPRQRVNTVLGKEN